MGGVIVLVRVGYLFGVHARRKEEDERGRADEEQADPKVMHVGILQRRQFLSMGKMRCTARRT